MSIKAKALRSGACLVTACAVLMPSLAAAWKPTSHVYFADLAVADALDDGKVSIPDLRTGEIRTYSVSADTLNALRQGRAHYRAGVLGPDAYPDLLTGQQVIHPEGQETHINHGSDAWLKHVWSSFGDTPQQKAFRLGFMTHAAGDMYGHSFVNYFTGGPFSLAGPNGLKHVVLEGYIDKRLPKTALTGEFFNASISGIEGRIYQSMVDARPGTVLDRTLLPAEAGKMSVPRIFSTLRAELEADINAHDTKYNELGRRATACGALDFSCSAVALRAQQASLLVETAYKKAWRDDIDDGLKAWPGVSHEVAKALFFNPQRHTDTAKADAILSTYALEHLVSMAGAPDAVGQFALIAGKVVDAITPDFLLAPIRALKENLLNALLEGAIGMNKQELEQYLKSPQHHFDQVMAMGEGHKVDLATFNREWLKISDSGYSNPDQAFDYAQIAATYNTVIASKLILLPPDEINRLIRDAGGRANLTQPNVMLGFATTLDGSNQWASGMVLAAECDVYRRVFKPVPGSTGCS